MAIVLVGVEKPDFYLKYRSIPSKMGEARFSCGNMTMVLENNATSQLSKMCVKTIININQKLEMLDTAELF